MSDISSTLSRRPVPRQEPAPDWGRACLAGYLSDLSDASGGHWRRRVYRKAAQAGAVAAGGHLSEVLANDSLVSAGWRLWESTSSGRETPEQALRDVKRVVRDGMRKGARAPKHPPPLRASGQEQVAEQVLSWEHTARSRAWTGRAGAGRLAVLMVLYRNAGRVGRLTLHESLRELQDAAGHSSHSVTASALSALEQAGWLRRLQRGPAQRLGRSTWELLTPPDTVAESSSIARCGLTAPADASEHSSAAVGWLNPSHDCWHQRQTAWRLVAWLAEHPDSCVSDAARALGLHRSTVRRQLLWLVSESLVVAVEVGGRERVAYSVVSGAELAAARAAESWPESPGQLRQERHRRDRAGWSSWLQAMIAQRERDRLEQAWERSKAALPPVGAAGDLGSVYDATTVQERRVASADC